MFSKKSMRYFIAILVCASDFIYIIFTDVILKNTNANTQKCLGCQNSTF